MTRYIKIPLRYLGEVGSYNVPAEQQQSEFDERVAGILTAVREGYIPAWATSQTDLDAVTVETEEQTEL